MAKWWEHLNGGAVFSSGPDEEQTIDNFNMTASRIFKALPKSERCPFFELLKSAYRLCAIEGYRYYTPACTLCEAHKKNIDEILSRRRLG